MEGAFFGNLFGSGALQSNWKDVYVDCSCAGGASNCPGVYVGRCLASDAPDGYPSASATEAADKHFSSIWGSSPSGEAVEYTNPITTFLADPWDGAAGRSNPAVRCAMFTAGNVTRPALECSAQY